MKESWRFKYSLIFPVIFILTLWLIKFFEYTQNLHLVMFGVYPLHIKGLIGIISSPLIHGDFAHLISNTIPLFIFMVGLFYFHKKRALFIFTICYFGVGIAVWFIGRYNYHIGASGIVYALASFHFFSGVLSKRTDFIAISLIIVFLYGGMIWGVLPIDEKVSWESHLMGFILGIILSLFYYKKIRIVADVDDDIEPTRKDFYDFHEVNVSEKDIEFEYKITDISTELT